MRLSLKILIGLVAATVATSPASAQLGCTLTVNQGGTMKLSMDGVVLGSEENGGTNAAILIASVGTSTVQVTAPDLIQWPSAYATTGQGVHIKYVGLGLLSSILQDYTNQTTSFSVGTIPLTSMILNARVVNVNSFTDGSYRVKTTVTCS